MRGAACTLVIISCKIMYQRPESRAGILFFCAFPNQGKPRWKGAMLSGRGSTFSSVLSYFVIFETFRPFHFSIHFLIWAPAKFVAEHVRVAVARLIAELRERDEAKSAMNAQLQKPGG